MTTTFEPGQKVALYSNHHTHPTYSINTVERLTKTRIVLASGSHYRKDTLRQVGLSHYDSPILISIDDPRLAAVDRRQALARIKSEALSAVDDWRTGAGGSALLARTAAAALIAYADSVDRD